MKKGILAILIAMGVLLSACNGQPADNKAADPAKTEQAGEKAKEMVKADPYAPGEKDA